MRLATLLFISLTLDISLLCNMLFDLNKINLYLLRKAGEKDGIGRGRSMGDAWQNKPYFVRPINKVVLKRGTTALIAVDPMWYSRRRRMRGDVPKYIIKRIKRINVSYILCCCLSLFVRCLLFFIYY